MCLPHKDVSDEVRSLAHCVEEGVNAIKDASGALQVKAAYKRFTFDFYKEDGGYSEKIPLLLAKQGQQKKK